MMSDSVIRPMHELYLELHLKYQGLAHLTHDPERKRWYERLSEQYAHQYNGCVLREGQVHTC